MLSTHDDAVLEHPRLQIPPDQLQGTFVFDVSGQPGHQPVVVDGIEVLLQVKAHHPGLAAFYKT